MSAVKPSKDADKLVRLFSLVSLLLARGAQPTGGDLIHQCAEGYARMTDDTFRRRFSDDREELAHLGINVIVEPGDAGSDVYRLPADAYYLPPIDLDEAEIAALGVCLHVLEGHFSYSRPLRLALLSLAQNRPELLDQSATNLVMLPEDRLSIAALAKLQAAIVHHKTVTFDYYALSRNQTTSRRVDPYGLHLTAGEWYLIGYCHERHARRTFRLSRIRSKVSHATRAGHDFAPPSDFDLDAFRNRPPWGLQAAVASAEIAVNADLAWWIEARWAQHGTLTHLDDGGIRFRTTFSDAGALASWVLGLGTSAELLDPPEVRELLRDRLQRIAGLLAEPPRVTARGEAHEPASAGAPARAPQIEVDSFTRVSSLAAYLLSRCRGDDDQTLPVATVVADLNTDQTTLARDLEILNVANFGAGNSLLYAWIEGSELFVSCDPAGDALRAPARLSPLQADALLLAVDLVGSDLPTPGGAALVSAAAKIRAVRRGSGPARGSTAATATTNPHFGDLNTAIREHRLLHIVYWSEGRAATTSRTVEPYHLIHNRGEWYYVCWCRDAAGTRVFRLSTTKQLELLDETFEPRAEVELETYRREGIPTTATYAARTARIWFAPELRPWISEQQPVLVLPDGACTTDLHYLDEQWLVSYLLRCAGSAVPLDPPVAAEALTAATERLLATYEAR